MSWRLERCQVGSIHTPAALFGDQTPIRRKPGVCYYARPLADMSMLAALLIAELDVPHPARRRPCPTPPGRRCQRLSLHDAGELVRRNDAVAPVAEWVAPQWPVQLGWGYAACAQLYEDVADGRHRLRCVLVFQSTDASALMRADGFSSLLCSFARARPWGANGTDSLGRADVIKPDAPGGDFDSLSAMDAPRPATSAPSHEQKHGWRLEAKLRSKGTWVRLI